MFLADYSCKISRKPINRAFHRYLWSAKNLGFGRSGDIFGRCLMIEMSEMPRNKEIQGLYGECQKFRIWQDRECFWQITVVRFLGSL